MVTVSALDKCVACGDQKHYHSRQPGPLLCTGPNCRDMKGQPSKAAIHGYRDPREVLVRA